MLPQNRRFCRIADRKRTFLWVYDRRLRSLFFGDSTKMRKDATVFWTKRVNVSFWPEKAEHKRTLSYSNHPAWWDGGVSLLRNLEMSTSTFTLSTKKLHLLFTITDILLLSLIAEGKDYTLWTWRTKKEDKIYSSSFYPQQLLWVDKRTSLHCYYVKMCRTGVEQVSHAYSPVLHIFT